MKRKKKKTQVTAELFVLHTSAINIGLLPSELSGSSKSLRGVLMAN